ncbi:MAG: hypothetical protein WAW02_03930 [Sideroxyarcus sp.]
MKLLVLGAITLVVVAGCTKVNIAKVTQIGDDLICIVDNPYERQAFRDAYERTIQAKGYKTRVVSDAKACQVSTTYTSRMGYTGWGPYLSDADLKVFSGDKLVGSAIYHAPKSPTSHGRFESKIAALVDQMLPSLITNGQPLGSPISRPASSE